MIAWPRRPIIHSTPLRDVNVKTETWGPSKPVWAIMQESRGVFRFVALLLSLRGGKPGTYFCRFVENRWNWKMPVWTRRRGGQVWRAGLHSIDVVCARSIQDKWPGIVSRIYSAHSAGRKELRRCILYSAQNTGYSVCKARTGMGLKPLACALCRWHKLAEPTQRKNVDLRSCCVCPATNEKGEALRPKQQQANHSRCWDL